MTFSGVWLGFLHTLTPPTHTPGHNSAALMCALSKSLNIRYCGALAPAIYFDYGKNWKKMENVQKICKKSENIGNTWKALIRFGNYWKLLEIIGDDWKDVI